MPTTLSFTHTLPPQLTHYFSGDLGTLSLGIPYHTCNATKVARETTVFVFVLFCFVFFSKLRFFSIHYNITGVENIVRYTKDFVISSFVIWRFHCTEENEK